MRRLILLLAALAAAAILLLGRDGTAPLRGARPPTAREAPPALPEAPGAPPDPAVAGLLDLLDTDAPRKDRIVARIAELGGEEAWAGLAARLLDPALGTTVETALGLHAPPAEVEALKRRMLDSPDAAARASIVRILAATADPAHGADVRGLLARERDATVRHGAIGALGRFGDRESADALVELMRSGGRDAGAAHYALLGIRNEGTLREIAIRWAALPAEARLGVLHATERPGPEAVAAARE
ncbi:MAG: HEAT repeat domain-containing protein, partial [Planctomycetes bacterium]|nr:HEAT repeat domain-containing protein [Planctomycetota bacterium]